MSSLYAKISFQGTLVIAKSFFIYGLCERRWSSILRACEVIKEKKFTIMILYTLNIILNSETSLLESLSMHVT